MKFVMSKVSLHVHCVHYRLAILFFTVQLTLKPAFLLSAYFQSFCHITRDVLEEIRWHSLGFGSRYCWSLTKLHLARFLFGSTNLSAKLHLHIVWCRCKVTSRQLLLHSMIICKKSFANFLSKKIIPGHQGPCFCPILRMLCHWGKHTGHCW